MTPRDRVDGRRSSRRSARSEWVSIEPRRGVVRSNSDRFRVAAPLVWLWTRRELRARYRQSVLRASWGIVQPVVVLAIYGWVLTAVLDVGFEGAPYLTAAWAGIVAFSFFQQALGQGVGSIQQAGALITRVYFPREVLPLAVAGSALVELGLMTAMLVVVAWVQVGPPTVHLLALVVVDLTLVVWSAGLGVLFASVTVFRRDLNHATPLLLRVLFIITPVVYPADLLRDRAPAVLSINPLANVIEGTRDVVIAHRWPDMGSTLAWLLGGVVVLWVALLVLRRLEPRMSEHV